MRCTISSEEARRVLAQAIWEATASHFDGDHLFFALIDHSWTFVHPSYAGEAGGVEPAIALSELLATLDQVRAADDRLAAADLGETVELPFEAHELAQRLEDAEARMQQDPFPELPLEEQKDILLCIDAARNLRAELTDGGADGRDAAA